ncbi:hypothetical protein D3C76_584140 [compost metagenome]
MLPVPPGVVAVALAGAATLGTSDTGVIVQLSCARRLSFCGLWLTWTMSMTSPDWVKLIEKISSRVYGVTSVNGRPMFGPAVFSTKPPLR